MAVSWKTLLWNAEASTIWWWRKKPASEQYHRSSSSSSAGKAGRMCTESCASKKKKRPTQRFLPVHQEKGTFSLRSNQVILSEPEDRGRHICLFTLPLDPKDRGKPLDTAQFQRRRIRLLVFKCPSWKHFQIQLIYSLRSSQHLVQQAGIFHYCHYEIVLLLLKQLGQPNEALG